MLLYSKPIEFSNRSLQISPIHMPQLLESHSHSTSPNEKLKVLLFLLQLTGYMQHTLHLFLRKVLQKVRFHTGLSAIVSLALG